MWGEWELWSECSKSCDGGKQTRRRDKLTNAKNGGKDCDGKSLGERDCNKQNCGRMHYQLTLF